MVPTVASASCPARSTAQRARALTFAGVVLAAASEYALQLVPATVWPKALGLVGLSVAAALFGLGAVQRFLPSRLEDPVLVRLNPVAALRHDAAWVAAGTGALAFITLLLRLRFGSVASTDLLLWAVVLLAFGLAFVGDIKPWRPSRPVAYEIGGVAALMLLFLLLNAYDVNDWYYSAIGDEYAFLNEARGVLNGGIRRPFAQDAVYGAHPMLGVLFQAAVMALFGSNHVGWILSSILSAALAIPAMYLLGRLLGGRVIALLAAALFASSHYLFAFSHLGYNNVMAPTPVAWAFALFVLSIHRQRAALLYGAGVATGLGFYTFYSARAARPILGLVVLAQYGWRGCVTPRGLRDRSLELWPLLLGFALAAAPIFAASGTAVITRMFAEVPGGSPVAATVSPLQKIIENAWLNVPAFFTGTHARHFTSGSLVDPVTAALAVLGFGLAVRWWSNLAAKLLLIWTLVAIGITALLSPYPIVAITRLLFAVPPLVLLAALAAMQVWTHLMSLVPERRVMHAAYGALAGLLLVVLALNLHRFWVTTPSRLHLTQETVVIRALRMPICGADMTRSVVVMANFGLLRLALLSYGPEHALPRMIPHAELRPNQPLPVDGVNCVIFGNPAADEARQQIEALGRAYPGAEFVPVQDLAGIGTVVAFRSPGEPG